MDDQPTTMVLRFRDLSQPHSFTIEQHNLIADANGAVWWGWWAKAGERPPTDTFHSLDSLAREVGLPILLYDSGQHLVFRTTCSAIEFTREDELLESPDPALTPDYYRASKSPTWLKLGHIDPANSEALLDLVYARVDSFFEERISRFGRYYGTRIRAEDLNAQQRSIWFARPAKANSRKSPRDKDITPYPIDFVTTRSRRLLWLSDLHFSRNAHEHGFPLVREPVRKPLAEATLRVLQETTEDASFGGLVVSGDLTFRASQDEFELAGAFLNELLGRAALDASHLVVVPGNHDVAFTSDPWKKEAKVQYASSTARREYERFYFETRDHPASAHLGMGARLLLGGAVPVEILGLNSSALQQKSSHFQGHGFVGQEQLDEAARQMIWTKPVPQIRAYRIVVLHHHVVPITPRIDPKADQRYSVVLDAGALLTWLADHRVDLVLHGHEHQPGATTITTLDRNSTPHTLTVVAGGSVGVAAEKVGDVRHNLFALVDFSRGAPPVIRQFTVNGNGDGQVHGFPMQVPTLERAE